MHCLETAPFQASPCQHSVEVGLHDGVVWDNSCCQALPDSGPGPPVVQQLQRGVSYYVAFEASQRGGSSLPSLLQCKIILWTGMSQSIGMTAGLALVIEPHQLVNTATIHVPSVEQVKCIQLMLVASGCVLMPSYLLEV